MTARQLVVHEALDTTKWRAGSNSWSFTPRTMVTSAPLDGADTTTRGRAGVEVPGGEVPGGEPAGGLDHDVHTELAPRQRLHLGLGEQAHAPVAHHHGVAVEGHGDVEAAEDRVPGEQAGEGRRWPQVVHGDHLEVELRSPRGAQQRSTRATEPVDTNPYRHLPLLTRVPRRTRQSAPSTDRPRPEPTPSRSHPWGRPGRDQGPEKPAQRSRAPRGGPGRAPGEQRTSTVPARRGGAPGRGCRLSPCTRCGGRAACPRRGTPGRWPGRTRCSNRPRGSGPATSRARRAAARRPG